MVNNSHREVIKKSACTFCYANCNVLVHVKDGKITKIEGNRENQISRGHICERIVYAIKWLYHPDQLMYPLKRDGNRGEGKWKRISWDTALDEITDKLKETKSVYGPESLVIAEGTYRSGPFWARSRFCSLYGNPQNVAHPGIACMLNCNAMAMAVVGGIFVVPPMSRTRCLVLWGQNPAESSSRMMASLKRRSEKGDFKLIVIDPRKTRVAEMADLWLQLRPGTDGALALGWLNIIIKEKLYNDEFVTNWTYGFEQLSERVKEYPPEKVAVITGLPVEQVMASARMYATTSPAIIVRGLATDQLGRNGTRVEQARIDLRAITGNLDVNGGDLISGVGPQINGKKFLRESQLELLDELPQTQKQKQLGYDKYRLMTWKSYDLTSPNFKRVWGESESSMHRVGVTPPLVWKAILEGKPYPVKAMISWACNPLQWSADTYSAYEAMKSSKLELSVVSDFWLTPPAELADYVLPAASWMEKPLCSTYEDFSEVVFGGERAIEPLGERKDDYTIWRELAKRMGQEDYWPWEKHEDVIKYQLNPLGITYEDFINAGFIREETRKYKRYETKGFATPTGKVELYSTILEQLGYDPLPLYEEPPESPVRTPELLEKYPLILNTGGRFMPMFHSEYRQLGIGMRERHPDPLVDINPTTASHLGIKDGDWVWIETRRGRIKQRAHLNDGILPDVVNAEAGWWFPEQPVDKDLHGLFESNANVLTANSEEFLDPLTGGWASRALLCRVYKV